MLNLDFSVFNWSLIQGFILKGLWFSIVLTIIATAGGIFFGTTLALMRLSGRKWLDVPASQGRQEAIRGLSIQRVRAIVNGTGRAGYHKRRNPQLDSA